jgi:hypothetical protein
MVPLAIKLYAVQSRDVCWQALVQEDFGRAVDL